MPYVAIRKGHGGADPGAVGNGLLEKNVNAVIGQYVIDGLRRCGFKVLDVRPGDQYVGLKAGTDLANNERVDAFYSFHVNSVANPQPRGMGSFVQIGYNSGNTSRIRNIIHDEVMRYLSGYQVPDYGKHEKDLHETRETNMSAVLFENLFISNAQDAALLHDAGFLKGLAEAYTRGICKAHGVQYVPIVPPAPPAAASDWENHPLAGEIRKAMATGILKGYNEAGTIFHPDANLSRAEAAVVANRILEKVEAMNK